MHIIEALTNKILYYNILYKGKIIYYIIKIHKKVKVPGGVKVKGQEYLQKIELMIERAWKEQMSIIEEAIHTIMDAIKSKRNIFIFGCSHAGILAEELFYRTGGLAVINPIFIRELMLDSKPVTLTSSFERIEGLAVKALRENPISAGDVFNYSFRIW